MCQSSVSASSPAANIATLAVARSDSWPARVIVNERACENVGKSISIPSTGQNDRPLRPFFGAAVLAVQDQPQPVMSRLKSRRIHAAGESDQRMVGIFRAPLPEPRHPFVAGAI